MFWHVSAVCFVSLFSAVQCVEGCSLLFGCSVPVDLSGEVGMVLISGRLLYD